ncbi:MAG: thioredoxin family protein [Candidatus Omnitrophica bacterium]|nr:thioredoxin family protein [Candidatus Omnitrophota bacterium]
MLRAVFGITLLVGLPVPGWAEAVVGAAAPAFTLTDTNGQPRSLGDFTDQFVVLEWFNKDCPFVRKHYDSGNMQRLQAAYTGRDVVWLSIVSSAAGKQGHVTAEEGTAVLAQRQAHPTALLLDPDGTVGRSYGAKTTPHLFIIKPGGTLIYAGAIDSTPSADPADVPASTNYVAQALDEAMAGKPVSVAETKSYGCSVKY